MVDGRSAWFRCTTYDYVLYGQKKLSEWGLDMHVLGQNLNRIM